MESPCLRSGLLTVQDSHTHTPPGSTDDFTLSSHQAPPAAQRLPAARPSEQVRFWLVLVRGQSRAGEGPPLYLSVGHR